MTTFIRHDDVFNALPTERQERIRAKAQAIQAHINLINLRKQQALTQADIAKHLDVSQSSISQLEQRGDMSLSSLIQYAHALGATLSLELVMPDGTHRQIMAC